MPETLSASLAVQKMHAARFTAALTAAGIAADVVGNVQDGQSLPYVVIGEDDESGGFRTQSTAGTVLPTTTRIYSHSKVEAKRIRDVLVQDQTDRGNLPALDAPFKIVLVEWTGSPVIPTARADAEDFYQIPLRIRYHITQT